MKHIFLRLLILLFLAYFLFSCERELLYVPHNVENMELMAKAEQLPKIGILTEAIQKEGRFIYLKVDRRFIYELEPLIKGEGVEYPKDISGAHMTIFSKNELKLVPSDLPELGKEYHFTLDSLAYAYTKSHIGQKRQFFFITVKSVELEGLRMKYGFPPNPPVPFHITIAVKRFS